MGWTYCTSWTTKEVIMGHLNTGLTSGYSLVKSSVVGNHHWQLIRRPNGELFIALNLLASGRDDGWGYKDMDESMGPYYYDCPLSFLDMAGPTKNETASAWREQVRAFHAAKKAKKVKLITGTILKYGNYRYQLTKGLGRRGWTVTRVEDGAEFRMSCQQVNQAELA